MISELKLQDLVVWLIFLLIFCENSYCLVITTPKGTNGASSITEQILPFLSTTPAMENNVNEEESERDTQTLKNSGTRIMPDYISALSSYQRRILLRNVLSSPNEMLGYNMLMALFDANESPIATVSRLPDGKSLVDKESKESTASTQNSNPLMTALLRASLQGAAPGSNMNPNLLAMAALLGGGGGLAGMGAGGGARNVQQKSEENTASSQTTNPLMTALLRASLQGVAPRSNMNPNLLAMASLLGGGGGLAGGLLARTLTNSATANVGNSASLGSPLLGSVSNSNRDSLLSNVALQLLRRNMDVEGLCSQEGGQCMDARGCFGTPAFMCSSGSVCCTQSNGLSISYNSGNRYIQGRRRGRGSSSEETTQSEPLPAIPKTDGKPEGKEINKQEKAKKGQPKKASVDSSSESESESESVRNGFSNNGNGGFRYQGTVYLGGGLPWVYGKKK